MAVFTFTFLICKCIFTVVFYTVYFIVKALALLATSIILGLYHFVRWIVVKSMKD